jgi:DNA-binding CsgD family transcriptional regulator
MINGKGVSEAGSMLGISEFTVRTHPKHIFFKMECSREADLVRKVLEHPTWILSDG